MTVEIIGLMHYHGRVFIHGCGKSTWFSQETGDRYRAELETLDPRYTSTQTGRVFELDERVAQEFIARVMAPAAVPGVVPMMNDYRYHDSISDSDDIDIDYSHDKM